jgi:pilus assembly protein CpaC
MKTLFKYILTTMHAALVSMVFAVSIIALPTLVFSQEDEGSIPEKSFIIEISKGKLVRLSSPASAVIAADPAIADVQVVSPSLVYINGKSIGETTVFAVDSQDKEILRAVVSVTNNLTKLNKAVKDLVPDANVTFQSVDGALVMNGDVDSPLQAEDVKRLAASFTKPNQTLVNMLRPLGSNQVMLKVKIAEVDRSELKRFGISLQNMSSISSFAFGLLRGREILDSTNVLGRNGTDNTIFTSFNDGQNSLNGVIDALEDNGLVSTLAEPTLTTQSGQAASFLAGGQFPVPVVTGSGSSAQVSVTYQPFGVSLAFTPVVLSKDRISLLVAPEVSSLSQTGAVVNAGFNIPALQTRRASTTVELGSGQSFAIAGLLQNDRSNDINKFPFLGDMPVLGALFRSRQFQHNQTELVIIVTPYIVDGVNNREDLHDPTQGMRMASEAESLLLGKLYKDYVPEKTGDHPIEAVDKPRLRGAAGHILK